MKIANDGFFSSASASRPSISPSETSAPIFFGGVCGSVQREQPERDRRRRRRGRTAARAARPRAALSVTPPAIQPTAERIFTRGKSRLGVREVVQRERVAQRQRRHEQRAVEDQQRVERRERRHLRQQAQHDAAEDAEHAEQLLRGEVAVGDQADEERRDHRADGERAVGQADLLAVEARACWPGTCPCSRTRTPR